MSDDPAAPDRPRVLHVLEAVRGGTSRHVADVVRAACDIDHHVALPPPGPAVTASGAALDTESVAAMAECGAVLHRIDMRRSLGRPANPLAAVRLTALAQRIRPDVMHGHSSVGGALARLSGARAHVPVVYTPNGLPGGLAAGGIERLLGRATTVFVAVSDSEADLARRHRLVPAGRIRVIPNGIDLVAPPPPSPPPDLRALLGLSPDVAVVGTMARLVDQKAPAEFVAVMGEIIRRRPDVHGLLIGMGPLQALVARAVAREGLAGRFHQIEHLARADGVLDQLDVFVLASRFEGGPYAPLEAMRAGVPVVLSDVVGNRDTVEAGRSGMLCAFGDADGMARAVIDLLGRDNRRAAMIEAAHARLRDRFDLVAMGRALSELYRSLAGSGR